MNIYSIPSKSPVFQQEKYSFPALSLTVDINNCRAVLDGSISLTLFYRSGTVKREIHLKDLLTYNGSHLTPGSFTS